MGKGLHSVQVESQFDVFAPPPIGSVLYCPGFPGFGSTIIDRSGKENHGTLVGATWARLSSGLPIISFDGTDDYVNFGAPASLNTAAQSWSVGMWFNSSNATNQYLWQQRSADGLDFIILVLLAAGTIRFNVSGGGAELNAGTFDTTSTWKDGKWHQLFCTWDVSDKKGRIYLDGALDSTSNANALIGALQNWATNRWGIASNLSGDFLGKSGLLTICNRAVTLPEIANWRNQTKYLFGV